MKKLITGLLTTLLFSILIGCSEDDLTLNEESTSNAQSLKEYEITENDLIKIRKLNFNTLGLRLVDRKNTDGTFEKYYIIEEDIMIPFDQVNEMISSNNSAKQYHSNNIVTNNRNITIRGVNQGANDLTISQQNALTQAIQNYNDLDIGLNFILTFGPRDNTMDINAIEIIDSRAGASADFPFNGNPGPEVRIFSGTRNLNAQILRHIWIHEFGHTLGLRHTDWFSRESCGLDSSEPINPPGFPNANGANHIPGTPTGFDPNSVMIACYNNSVPGEFGGFDIVALNFLYPLSLSLTGSSLICNNSTEIYNLNNTNFPITWTTSSNLQILSSSDNSITVKPVNSSFNGSGFIQGTSPTQNIRKDVWVGKAVVDYIEFGNGIGETDYFCSSHYGNTYDIFPRLPGTTHQIRVRRWPSLSIVYSPSTNYSGNSGTLNYTPSPGWYVFEIRRTNPCGTSEWFETEVEFVDCSNNEGGGEF
ncbi:M57 family metalloprotease [uncultured Aquimarina sp.]|uniref:M57 family metalloprotease n=1 Tax=uncultured Aquimarina sp. TaxID=575652 RepID=UPI00260D1C29|nr:M57 family metalloprotease [uncultured Aquimarina sp.]